MSMHRFVHGRCRAAHVQFHPRCRFQLYRGIGIGATKAKLLFTPGPLTTSDVVKTRMAKDMGSRDGAFIEVVKRIRERLLQAARTSREDGYECVLVQGAGSMAVESMLGSAVPREGAEVLIFSNGSYGERQEKICQRAGIPFVSVRHPWNEPITRETVHKALRSPIAANVTHVSMVHHETTAGVVNALEEVGHLLKTEYPHLTFMVDSMSAFGAYDAPVKDWGIHYLVSSANKCIEGIPGFAFVICQRNALLSAEGSARSLVLDLQDQFHFMEKSGQFRFTPPVQALLAYDQALDEWDAEGGVVGRAARYQKNYEILSTGMEELGFQYFVKDPSARGYIITTFEAPSELRSVWDFQRFYDLLNDRGVVIYPSSLPSAEDGPPPAFRVGNIGQIFPHDVEAFVASVKEVLLEMGLPVPLR